MSLLNEFIHGLSFCTSTHDLSQFLWQQGRLISQLSLSETRFTNVYWRMLLVSARLSGAAHIDLGLLHHIRPIASSPAWFKVFKYALAPDLAHVQAILSGFLDYITGRRESVLEGHRALHGWFGAICCCGLKFLEVKGVRCIDRAVIYLPLWLLNQLWWKDIWLRVGDGLVIIYFKHGGVTKHHLRIIGRVVVTLTKWVVSTLWLRISKYYKRWRVDAKLYLWLRMVIIKSPLWWAYVGKEETLQPLPLSLALLFFPLLLLLFLVPFHGFAVFLILSLLAADPIGLIVFE